MAIQRVESLTDDRMIFVEFSVKRNRRQGNITRNAHNGVEEPLSQSEGQKLELDQCRGPMGAGEVKLITQLRAFLDQLAPP